MRAQILGSGGSSGVPSIGGNWGQCNPHDRRNRRLRPALLVEHNQTTILVDTPPELRLQLLRGHITRLDAVLYTHAHADHCHGIDDLREICRLLQSPLPCYADENTLKTLKKRFDYCFLPWTPQNKRFISQPILIPHIVTQPFRVKDIDIIPFTQDHGLSMTLGYRFGTLAYSIDVKRLYAESCNLLQNLDVWIVDCIRITPPHPVHFVLQDVLSYVGYLKPKRTILTHLSADIDYHTFTSYNIKGIELAYDGMTLEL